MQEEKECLAHAEIFGVICLLGFVLAPTLPLTLYFILTIPAHSPYLYIAIVHLFSAFFIAFRVWHIYLDARLLGPSVKVYLN